MNMKVEIVKLDNLGRGIGYINGKIIFIPKSLPGDILEVDIKNEKKNFMEGKIIKIIKASNTRIKPLCPYFFECGGCDLQHLEIEKQWNYKLKKINELLKINNINYEVKEIIPSLEQYNYRNKISLKIVNKEIGFYENNTHHLIKIDNCSIVNNNINNIIKDLYLLNITNGTITIRVNYNNELLLIINSEDKVENISKLTKEYKIKGIIQNNKILYGQDYLIDKINDYQFKVSYDAFFQVNPYICSKLFTLIENSTINSHNVLDLYCGVGTLSIVAKKNSKRVMGVEIVPNAIANAKYNLDLNKVQDIEFLCSDTKKIVNRITSDFDTIILDPPRSGVDKNVINKIIREKISKIIYISCNENTLIRDLKLLLNNYQIIDLKLLDMFSNTEHVECMCVLNLR